MYQLRPFVLILSLCTCCLSQGIPLGYYPNDDYTSPYPIAGDINLDGRVDFEDFAYVAENWLLDIHSAPSPDDPYREAQEEQLARYRIRGLLHALTWGLELHRNEYGDYAPSSINSTGEPADFQYVGAQRLSEALFGQDLLGLHPQSRFRGDEWDTIYLAADMSPEQIEESVLSRSGPFASLDDIKVFRLSDIYPNVGNFNGDQYVICDGYEQPRHSGLNTGMPILYFKARLSGLHQDHTDDQGTNNDIYALADNFPLLQLGTAGNDVPHHPLADGIDDLADFEQSIIVPIVPFWSMPHRRDSFILMSAGPDGLYGTIDDVFNFY